MSKKKLPADQTFTSADVEAFAKAFNKLAYAFKPSYARYVKMAIHSLRREMLDDAQSE
jgi:hypothetical protein